MGLSKKSHGAKENKETQSPVLKIFKDIMQRENTDPEKVTLLKDKQKKEKRKSFSTRAKYDQKSYDSSSTDKYGRIKQHKITVQGLKEEKPQDTFQGEKKDSWWFKRDKTDKKPDDTCSCVSCALKKLIGSEYICVGCLLVLFTMSVVVAFLMVFRTPSILETSSESGKKIQLTKRQLNEDGTNWKTPNSIQSYSSYLGPGYADSKLRSSVC